MSPIPKGVRLHANFYTVTMPESDSWSVVSDREGVATVFQQDDDLC